MAQPRQPRRPGRTTRGKEKIARKPVFPQFQPSFETAEARTALNQLVQKSSAARQELETKVSEQRELIKSKGGIGKPQNFGLVAELRALEKQCKGTLTPKETQVMKALIEQMELHGKRNVAAIARIFRISTQMVDTYIKRAKVKLRRMMIEEALASGAITSQELQQAALEAYASPPKKK